MCGFIVQLVEHRTGISEVTGAKPVEALIFSGFFFPIAQIGKLTARIILHFHLHPQFKYELFHIYFTSRPMSLLTAELAYDFSMLLTRCCLMVLRRQVFNQRNALNERSAEHRDVASMTARICTTLENSGNISNRSFSCIAP